MRVTFLVQSAHKLGGTERSAISQANALAAAGHEVRILSVVKAAEEPVFAIDDRVKVDHLVDLTDRDRTTRSGTRRPSLLVPERWDKQFSALTDVGLEQGLRGLSTDVLVTVTPGTAGLRPRAGARLGGGGPPGAPVVLAADLGDGAAAGQRAARRRGRAPDPEHRGVAARPSSGRSLPRSW